MKKYIKVLSIILFAFFAFSIFSVDVSAVSESEEAEMKKAGYSFCKYSFDLQEMYGSKDFDSKIHAFTVYIAFNDNGYVGMYQDGGHTDTIIQSYTLDGGYFQINLRNTGYLNTKFPSGITTCPPTFYAYDRYEVTSSANLTILGNDEKPDDKSITAKGQLSLVDSYFQCDVNKFNDIKENLDKELYQLAQELEYSVNSIADAERARVNGINFIADTVTEEDCVKLQDEYLEYKSNSGFNDTNNTSKEKMASIFEKYADMLPPNCDVDSLGDVHKKRVEIINISVDRAANKIDNSYNQKINYCVALVDKKAEDEAEKDRIQKLKEELENQRRAIEEKERQEREKKDRELAKEIAKKIELIKTINLGKDVIVADCDSVLGPELIDLLAKYYGYLKIAAPILLIIFGSVDFGGAVISQDKQALEKAISKFVKRAIVCVAIFFIPLILKYLFSYVTIDGQPLIDDPTCGIK